MNMKKLAQLAGVSVATVSKAFSGSKEISDAKRQHIFEIAKENGCYDKYCKVTFDKKVIGVISPEIESSYYSQQLTSLEKEINAKNGIMLVATTNFQQEKFDEILSYFAECLKVDGVIIYNNKIERPYNLPIVSIGNNKSCDSVTLSIRNSINDAIQHFKEYGHSNIGFIGEKYTSNRYLHFINAMNNNNCIIKEEYMIQADKRFEEAGYGAMNRLLNLENPPTAILAAYDSIALGAMKSINEHGLSIPVDISLIGIDDMRENQYLNVPLSSITSYNEDLCQIVVDLLFDRIENGNAGERRVIKVTTELIKRGSVGKIRRS